MNVIARLEYELTSDDSAIHHFKHYTTRTLTAVFWGLQASKLFYGHCPRFISSSSLLDDWPIFMISGSKEQLQQQLEYILQKPYCHSWWISKIWTSGHFRRTICNKNSILNLEKMTQKCIECFRLLLEHLAWSEHQFLSGIRDSRKAGSLWGMMRGVGGVRKSIHQGWLAKGLGFGLLCWGFKGAQEEIPSEEASTLQIGSVAFPPGQCTSPQLHRCHRLFDQDGDQDSSSASL